MRTGQQFIHLISKAQCHNLLFIRGQRLQVNDGGMASDPWKVSNDKAVDCARSACVTRAPRRQLSRSMSHHPCRRIFVQGEIGRVGADLVATIAILTHVRG